MVGSGSKFDGDRCFCVRDRWNYFRRVLIAGVAIVELSSIAKHVETRLIASLRLPGERIIDRWFNPSHDRSPNKPAQIDCPNLRTNRRGFLFVHQFAHLHHCRNQTIHLFTGMQRVHGNPNSRLSNKPDRRHPNPQFHQFSCINLRI